VSAVALVDEVVEDVRTLDEAAARWAGDQDRAAAAEAVTATDRSIVLLHRVRDELTPEIRVHDRQHRPYNDRD
jgi:hypothetical protein